MRLVLSVLSRPRPVPGAWSQALRHVPAGRGRGQRPEFWRKADALALELSRSEHCDPVVAHGVADIAGGGMRGGRKVFCAARWGGGGSNLPTSRKGREKWGTQIPFFSRPIVSGLPAVQACFVSG